MKPAGLIKEQESMGPIRGRIRALVDMFSSSRGYFLAIVSGYVLVAANIVAQLALTPIYLDKIGRSQFGILMMILNFINFAAIGIGWMSGGLTRVLAERAAKPEEGGLSQAFSLGKTILVSYAVLISVAGACIWFATNPSQGIPLWLLFSGLYLIVLYESNPERLLYVALRKQATGNLFEIARVVVFVLVTVSLLPIYPRLEVVLIAYILGILVQRALLAFGLHRTHPELWRKPGRETLPLLRRLAGRQGAQYLIYGAIVLGMQADVLILGFLAGPDAAAKLAVLWKIPEALSVILWRIPSAIEPYVIHMDAKGDKDGIRKSFRRGRPRFVLITAGVALVYAVSGKFITGLWVGQFAPEQDWMYWLSAAAMFLLTITRWPVSFAYALIQLRPLIAIAAIELVGKIALIVALLPYFSYVAPIAATTIMHVLLVGWAYQIILRVR